MCRIILCFGLALVACGEATEYSLPLSADGIPRSHECTPGDRRINADGAMFYCDTRGQWACQAAAHPEGNDSSQSPDISMTSDDAGIDDAVTDDAESIDVSDSDNMNSGDVPVGAGNTGGGDDNVDGLRPRCPDGAQWLTENIGSSPDVFGFDSVLFEPNETKFFCIQLPERQGNARVLLLHASGRYNDHGCEQMMLEATVPAESTVDPRHLQSIRSRAPDLRIAAGFSWQDSDLAPPGLYVLKATEVKGVRQPGEKVCRNYRIYAVVSY